MTPDAFVAKWTSLAEDLRRHGALVNGAALCDDVLADFAALMATQDAGTLTLR